MGFKLKKNTPRRIKIALSRHRRAIRKWVRWAVKAIRGIDKIKIKIQLDSIVLRENRISVFDLQGRRL
jgi:hypothetical protein